MDDDEAKLCWEIAEATHRQDWWKIKDEHTPYEWACQFARKRVAPWGDERADFRAAINTVRLVLAFAGSDDIDVDVVAKLIDALRNYTQPTPDEPLSPDAMQKVQAHG